ncbi:MAG: Shedu anti-phage system protein SduA domain-containing protein [Acidimicrobiales bacterium]
MANQPEDDNAALSSPSGITDALYDDIRRFYEAYYEAAAEYGDAILSELPSFVRGPHSVEVLVGPEAIAVLTKPSQRFEYTAFEVSGDIRGAIFARSGGIVVGWDSAIDLHLAGVQLVRARDRQIVARPHWDHLYVTSIRQHDDWTAAAGRAEAARDVPQLLAARLMDVSQQLRDCVGDRRDRTASDLRETVRAFKALLDLDPSEEEVQVFLSEHPVMLFPTALSVRPKVKLGSEWVTDFVIRRSDTDYELVEIEPPGHPLYTRQQNPSHQLTHALKQVLDWRQWVSEFPEYARLAMPGIARPQGRVVIGRRAQLTDESARALHHHNQELNHIVIDTYDDLIARVEHLIDNITSGPGSS